jgi:hypothetical protein
MAPVRYRGHPEAALPDTPWVVRRLHGQTPDMLRHPRPSACRRTSLTAATLRIVAHLYGHPPVAARVNTFAAATRTSHHPLPTRARDRLHRTRPTITRPATTPLRCRSGLRISPRTCPRFRECLQQRRRRTRPSCTDHKRHSRHSHRLLPETLICRTEALRCRRP